MADAVAGVRTHPRAVPQAITTIRKSIHEFLCLYYIGMVLRLAALRAAGALLKGTEFDGAFCKKFNSLG